ncbi:hypothetical protein I350_07360 [Cryptococcus amylolentus CBS 6273]|uniref:Uncharacterized protein n=1 Tax=Cryptococcus amylolentus CBS 6273 TaxID=1296118 RepID=A0A1E3JH03_9TREE|nr:hypothetical protein I350_07360 [Cryptococcus amylolentus CBS 6273]
MPSPAPDDTILWADDEHQSDDDDDIPVFFGAHKSEERLFQTLARPAQQQPSHPKDSLRRRTLLLSTEKPRHKHGALSDKDYVRLYRSAPSDESDSCSTPVSLRGPSTPARSEQDPSNLTFDFGTLRLSTPNESRDQEDSDPPSEGSDKENVPVPSPAQGAPPVEEMSFERFECDCTRHGSLDLNDEDDSIPELDMGGLKLSDFADGETGATYHHIDDFGSCSSDELQKETTDKEGRVLQPHPSLTPVSATPEHQSLDFDDATSPLEVARAGPVAIPVLHNHHFASIRADVGSPCRNLPPSPMTLPALAQDETPAIRLASIDSPTKLVSPAVPMTPSHTSTVPPADLVQRGAKTVKAEAGGKGKGKPQPLDHKQSTALKMTIKSQLDSAILPKVGAPRSDTMPSSGLRFSSAPSGRTISAGTSSHPVPREVSKPHPERPQTLENRPEPRPARRPLLKFSSASASGGSAIPRPALASKSSLPRPKNTVRDKSSSMLPPPSSIPLKRPAVSQPGPPLPSAMAPRRSVLSQPTINHTRPTLGQPARAFQSLGTPVRAAPLFSVGVGGEMVAMPRVGMKSPAKSNMLHKKQLSDRETPRKLGTPMRFGTPRQQPSALVPLAASVPCMANFSTAGPTMTILASSPTRRSSPHKSMDAAQPAPRGPVAMSTRHASENPDNPANKTSPPSAASQASSTAPSESNQVESSQSSRSSPPSSPRPAARRAKRASAAKTPAAKATSKPSTPSAPALTEKQLKTTTARNTARNQVYHCAIDRQIIRQPGPRPPSPTSKIRTTSDREEEDRKNAREVRARRRKGEPEEDDKPVLEKIEVLKAPGDEEEYTHSPVRPAKRSRTSTGSNSSEGRKRIRWDREILVIHSDGAGKRTPSEEPVDASVGKSCIKTKTPLDEHGNVIDAQRPVDDLKRTRVVVSAIFYDGEEPIPAPASATRSKKK